MKNINIGFYGTPNSGKSTLINSLIQHNIQGVSDKPQTTHKVHSIVLRNKDLSFTIFDTPGINFTRKDAHVTKLNAIAQENAKNNDINFLVVPVNKLFIHENLLQIPNLKGIIISKVDMVSRSKEVEAVDKIFNLYEIEKIFCTSGKCNMGINHLFNYLNEYGSLNPQNKTSYELTIPQTTYNIFLEQLRETIFKNIHKEIPYQINYSLGEFHETQKSIHCKGILEVHNKRHYLILKSPGLLIKMGQELMKKGKLLFNKDVFCKLYPLYTKR